MNKTKLISHLRDLLQQKINISQASIHEIRTARNSDTKSSAGDKHEVGRAMAQIELDNQQAQLAKTLTLLEELDRIPLGREFRSIAFGSLIGTDTGNYFISIGLGKVMIQQDEVYVISLASPIGKALEGKRVGEVVRFKDRVMTIHSIE